jgi:hypothetical protein
MITQPGREITWGKLYVGSRSIFAAAGFAEVSRPTRRRVVMLLGARRARRHGCRSRQSRTIRRVRATQRRHDRSPKRSTRKSMKHLTLADRCRP